MKRPVVFLSHSHADAEFARELGEKLNADGIDAWLDAVEIKVGETIHAKVNEGLRNSDFFAIILSTASVNSRWVQEELSSASNLEKYSKKRVFVLPILLEVCDVPPLLLDRRYANFERDPESAYSELVYAIRTHHRNQGLVEPTVLSVEGLTPALIKAFASDADRLQELAPRQFEELVAGLLRHFGYDAKLTAYSGDGGIDIMAVRNQFPGLTPERMIVNCKRYRPQRKISQSFVRELMGVLVMSGESHGALVTSSSFTAAATESARRAGQRGWRIDLVDGLEVSGWIRRYLEDTTGEQAGATTT